MKELEFTFSGVERFIYYSYSNFGIIPSICSFLWYSWIWIAEVILKWVIREAVILKCKLGNKKSEILEIML